MLPSKNYSLKIGDNWHTISTCRTSLLSSDQQRQSTDGKSAHWSESQKSAAGSHL